MDILPVRRDVKLHLPQERINDWHPDGRHVTHFYNALSLFFPAGERFFIDSVRHYRDDIQDPELKKAVTGFIGQEAMHSREHEEYNALIENAGLPAAKMDGFVLKLLNLVRKIAPKSSQLAITIALEHYTAILANMLLTKPRLIQGSDPAFLQAWHWHAYEETEHKAVAYDVWNAVMKPGVFSYLRRAISMLVVTAFFWPLVMAFHITLVAKDPACKHNRVRGFGSVIKLMWGSVGAFWGLIPEWLEYFKPSFHPWDQDNRELLANIDALIEQVQNSGRAPVALSA